MIKLGACPLFRPLSAGELEELGRWVQVRQVAAGTEIFREGDTGDGLYVVGSGLVQISCLISSNVRHVFSEVGPGEAFGEMAVLEEKPRSATALAKVDTRVHFIPRDAMLRLAESSPQFSLGLVREISNRLREFNRQYVREVLQTERLTLVGRFARSIVHDLKNPLNIISITSEMAGMETSTPESRKLARTRISKQVERISELVNEILEFTQGSHTAFVLAPTDYSVFVRQLLEEIRPELELRSATVEVETPAPKGGKIFLRFHLDGSNVVTEIEDTGSGIAPEIADGLFAAFATYGKAHGTGLGLSISKKIVEDHGGTISARNLPGRGALFYFSLPIHHSA